MDEQAYPSSSKLLGWNNLMPQNRKKVNQFGKEKSYFYTILLQQHRNSIYKIY